MFNRRTTALAELIMLGLGLLLLGGSMGWNLAAEHRRLEATERRRLADMATVVHDNLGRQLDAVNGVLASIQRDLPALLRQPDGLRLVNQRLESQCLAMPGLRTLFVLDRDGTAIACNRPALIGHNFRERPYFKSGRARNDPSALQVTPPFRNFLGTFAIDLQKTLVDDQGRFHGLVSAVLDPAYFTTLLSSVNYTPDMWTYLAHGDGTLFVLVPRRDILPGSALARPGSLFSRHLAGGLEAEVLTGRSLMSGQRRMAAFRSVRPPALAMDVPLVIGVTRSLDDLFAPWWRDFRIETALFALVALSAGGGLYLHVQRQRRYAELSEAQDAQLRRSEARMRLFFERKLVGMAISSPDEGWVEVNDRFCELLGRAREELLGCHWQALTLPEDLPGDEAAFRRLLTGEVDAYTQAKRYVRKDGTLLHADLSVGCVRQPGGAIDSILAVMVDQTERLRAEEERRVIYAQLLQSQKMESLGVLAGGVAHDMNNVLGAILALATANLPLQPKDSPGREAFATIAGAAQRGGKMVKSLLSFARKNPAERLDLDLNALLLEEVALLERVTLAKVKLLLDLSPDLSTIRGDGGALVHAIMNLCVNAVDAMPEGGTLTLTSRNVPGGWVEVGVADTGTGMPGEVLAKAMDPFFTTKEVGKGTGLGLSMVYATVKAHDGEVLLQSEPGRGTQVTLRFPAASPATAAARAVVAAAGAGAGAPLKVLLVDDDELIQKGTGMMVGLLGHAVTTVASGEEALALLEGGYHPDAVILDMNMPGLGGKGSLPRLRLLCPEAPVFLATGRVDQDALDLVAGHAGVTLLAKPYGIDDLRASLRRVGEAVS